ncbi:hypothetical protein LshimejAT787_1202040 [Lyophyllum shimeji]|uniref:Uncharacterized protein n=1 Tax=Lyophyllum shimeji TaxID=47721 RepID=A0A9P3PVF8_LYOSH|nr:hypothetical protein LshimejAT787_1202040 [Lyophyllum shimeji]
MLGQANFRLETWPQFRACAPVKCGIVVEGNKYPRLLPDAPKVLTKSSQRALVGALYMTQVAAKPLYLARPKLPEDECLLLAKLLYLDYEERPERIDHGGVWPKEGILLSRRSLFDVQLWFKDPPEVIANAEQLVVTDASGVGNHPAP